MREISISALIIYSQMIDYTSLRVGKVPQIFATTLEVELTIRCIAALFTASTTVHER
jgi:hypothetical protein